VKKKMFFNCNELFVNTPINVNGIILQKKDIHWLLSGLSRSDLVSKGASFCKAEH